VQEIYTRVIHAHQAPSYFAPAPVAVAGGTAATEEAPAAAVETPASNLMRFLEQKAPAFAQAAARAKLGRTQAAFEHFLERVIRREEWIRALNSDGVLCGYLLEIFQNSPFFAEQLMRQPDYLEEIRTLRARGVSTVAYGEVLPLLE
jgi:hypothetical protein